MDLPPINVTFQPEAGIKFSFSHPSVLYGQKLLAKPKRRQKKPNDRPARKVSEFSFSAVVNGDKVGAHSFSHSIGYSIVLY